MKKVMWLCNMAPGEIRKALGGTDRGALWMDHVFNDLKKSDMFIRVLYADLNSVDGVLDNKCSYRSYQEKEPYVYLPELENLFVEELQRYTPDIVHIWGTEYGHTLAMVNAAERAGYLDKVVISIQGLCSVISKHYAEGVPYDVQKANTFRDFIKRNSIRDQQRYFSLRGELEEKALSKVHHVIGRTEWDKACVTKINSNVTYHFCNETLREEFYQDKWKYEQCRKYRIFASSAEYPVKGFHYLLEAMGEITKHYPDAEVVVAGASPFPKQDMFGWLRESVYSKYLKSLIRKNGLEGKIHVLGFLNAAQMKEEFLKSNVFVLPSTIENSPNSLGEAMVLGVPCIASDVGGVTDLMIHKREGYVYQSTAPYMLAHYIMKVFEDGGKAEMLGELAREHAIKVHSPQANLAALIEIYDDMQSEGKMNENFSGDHSI